MRKKMIIAVCMGMVLLMAAALLYIRLMGGGLASPGTGTITGNYACRPMPDSGVPGMDVKSNSRNFNDSQR